MADLTRRKLLSLAAAAPLVGSLADAMGAAGGTKRGRPVVSFISPRERLRELHFPNVALRTHENKPVRFYDDVVRGKIVTLNYMYTQCKETCPLTTEHLVQVQRILGKRVGREVFMYSLTLNPDQDTPEVLRNYMKMHGVGPGWTFLTGKPDDLELLRRKLGFIDPNPKVDRDRTNHIGSVLIGNEPLMLWTCCPSLSRPVWIEKHIAWVGQLKDLQVTG
jgi:protein SCO1/2